MITSVSLFLTDFVASVLYNTQLYVILQLEADHSKYLHVVQFAEEQTQFCSLRAVSYLITSSSVKKQNY